MSVLGFRRPLSFKNIVKTDVIVSMVLRPTHYRIIGFTLLICIIFLLGLPNLKKFSSANRAWIFLPQKLQENLANLNGQPLLTTLKINGEDQPVLFSKVEVISNQSSDPEGRQTYFGRISDSQDTLSILIRDSELHDKKIFAALLLHDGNTTSFFAESQASADIVLKQEPVLDDRLRPSGISLDDELHDPQPLGETRRSAPVMTVRGPPPARIFEITVDFSSSSVQNYGIQALKDFIANVFTQIQPLYDRELGVTLRIGHEHFWLPTNYTGAVPANSASESYTIGPDPMRATDPSSRLIQLQTQWSSPGFVENAKDAVLLSTSAPMNQYQGVAYQAAACSLAAPAVVVRSSGAYDLSAIAHELGHLLGAGHAQQPVYTVSTSTIYDIMYPSPLGYSPAGFGPTQRSFITNRFTDGTLNCLLTDVVRPWVRSAPSSLTVVEGTSLNIPFDVGGGTPMTYHWRKYIGNAYTDLPQFNSSTLSLPSVALADAGYYQVEALNAAGSTGNTIFGITVTPRPPPSCVVDVNHDGQVSAQDIFTFLAYWFAADMLADWNHDGHLQANDIFDYLAQWFFPPVGC